MTSKSAALKFLVLSLAFVSLISAQTNKPEKIIMDSSKPSVYLEFFRIIKDKSLYIDDSKERVQLKLTNNTKWSIYIYHANYGENEEMKAMYFYTEKIKPDLPTKVSNSYSPIHAGATTSELKSGKSVEFSIPRNHLAENLKIRIDYDFEWEDWGNHGENLDYKFSMPIHSIYFSHSDLERAVNGKEIILGSPLNLPTPSLPLHNFKFKLKAPQAIVQAKIDEKGNVISAKAISGHPILRSASETAAKDSKFSQTKLNGVSVRARAVLLYEFNLNEESSKVEVKSIEAIKPN